MSTAAPTDTNPSLLVHGQSCHFFSVDEIRSATQNFDEALVIGRGGFGKVYKGQINDASNTVVAIKRSSSKSNQGALEFQAEVEMLSKIRHCNLVSLIGYCNQGTEMALVYEYMPEGTLEDHLHKDGTPLSWLRLLRICIGAARGLEYLHTGTGSKHGIIHRDVKSSNILLDKNFAAKISDFGLAKIGPTNQTRTHVSTMVKGTFGYLDPHYVYTGELTRKSDVYSFGVLLLRVICGRPAVDTSLDENQWGLAPWAQDRIKEGKHNHIVDSRLKAQVSSTCLKDFTRIASQCLHNLPNQRPRMAEIVARLEIIISLQERVGFPITEKKFMGKLFHSFFQATVEQKEREDDKVNNAMVTRGKAKVDLDHGDVLHLIHKSGSEGEPSDKAGKVTFDLVSSNPRVEFELILKPFSFDVLNTATNNFGPDRVLGYEFGSVFKGWIDEPSLVAGKPSTGTVIAVRRIKHQYLQDHPEWLAEINYLGLLNHPNLVKLIGYCIRGDRRFVICEFMPQGSLEDLLFRRGAEFEPLSWNLRIKVALGAAKGLAFLHSQEPKVIWCDINPNCILVDSDHNGKLSNFWLTENAYVASVTATIIRRDATSEYTAPEYIATGCFTARSDIYSFGVVLLGVLTGKRNIDNKKMQVKISRPYLDSKQRIRRIIDHRIKGQYSPAVAIAFAMILKSCLSINPGDRPTADEVVNALEELEDLQKASPSPRDAACQ